MTGFKLLKRVFVDMTDDDDQGVTLHCDGPGEESDSDDDVNLDEVLGSPSNDGAPAAAAEPTPATMTAVAPTAVIDPTAPTVAAPITASAGTAAVATTAVSTPAGPASTEPTPAITNPVAASAPTVALAVDEATANANDSAVTASAADNATRGTTTGRVIASPLEFAIPVNHRSTRSMQFYPKWAELHEVIYMKYEAAGISSDVFYYVISNYPNKEALAMRKVSERRSNVNADTKLYGRGPGGCVPESKWEILAEENVVPSISRTPAEWCHFYEHPVYGPGANWHFCAISNRPFANLSFQLTLLLGLASKRATMLHVKIPTVGYVCNVVEWPLVNARGHQNPSLDTAEAVNRQNVAHKIDQVVAWIAATYNAGDVAIWDSRPPAGFNMGPRIKILVEGYEREIFPNGTPP
ncbi:unnamed protein product [Closterium sp. Yama58-4]|nr:unnamed protein product [Closterium sp. Yama58-4]